MKNLLKTLGLLLFSTLVAIIFAEIAIRIVVPQRLDSIREIYAPDDDVVFKLKKNLSIVYSQFEFEVHETTNSLGLRDHEIAPKPSGGYRILGLGDSFSYANGTALEETYFKRVEACLIRTSGKPTEIINCAVPAYSLLQEVRTFKKLTPSLTPDAAIIGFYVGNDFGDSYDLFDSTGKATIGVTASGNIASTKSIDQERGIRGLTSSLRLFLATRSHFYIFLRNRLSELLSKLQLRSAPPPPDFCAKEFSDNLKKGWELDQRLLLEAADYARQQKLRLVVVVLPAIYQVYEQAWSQYFTTYHADPNKYDLYKPQALMAEFCRLHNIECVDMLPSLRQAGKQLDLYYPIDSHMRPEGHRVVADSLCRYLSVATPAAASLP